MSNCHGRAAITVNSRLDAAQEHADSLLCVGLDPDPERLGGAAAGPVEQRVEQFCRRIIDATQDRVCAYKPQIAHFAALGAEDVLAAVIKHIHQVAPHVLVLLDAKRNDIGSTAARYAVEAFERYGADAVTVNPYLGIEGLQPFLDWHDRGVIVLCRTSNPGADPIQCQPPDDPLFLRIARWAEQDWNRHDNVMLVTGATQPEDLSRVRRVAPSLPLLLPGVGAQGADLDAAVEAGLRADGRGVIVNSARGIIHAGDGGADAVRAAATTLRDSINTTINNRRPSPVGNPALRSRSAH